MLERLAVPADVQQRLDHHADHDLLRSRGPVNDEDAGTVLPSLADLAAQAILHDQRPLALALCQAVDLLTHLTATEVAEVA
jgi:hypothetical protein